MATSSFLDQAVDVLLQCQCREDICRHVYSGECIHLVLVFTQRIECITDWSSPPRIHLLLEGGITMPVQRLDATELKHWPSGKVCCTGKCLLLGRMCYSLRETSIIFTCSWEQERLHMFKKSLHIGSLRRISCCKRFIIFDARLLAKNLWQRLEGSGTAWEVVSVPTSSQFLSCGAGARKWSGIRSRPLPSAETSFSVMSRRQRENANAGRATGQRTEKGRAQPRAPAWKEPTYTYSWTKSEGNLWIDWSIQAIPYNRINVSC